MTYPWSRYWYELDPEGRGRPYIENGFLSDPESDYARYFNAGVVQLKDLSQVQFLGLLGEPGSGKSTAVREYARGTATSSGTTDTEASQPVVVKIRDFGSHESMVDWLLSHPVVAEWAHGRAAVEVIWDGLDEASYPNAGSLLGLWLLNESNASLRARIVSRSMAWSEALNGYLFKAAEKVGGSFKVYALAPLRRSDVRMAMRGVQNPDEVLAEITRRGLGPLAATPALLFAYISRLREGALLPKGRSEAFDLAVAQALSWFEGKSPRRGVANASGARELLLRIAGVTTFCAIERIRIDNAPGGDGEANLLQILQSPNLASNQTYLPDSELALQVLDCPLFTSPTSGTRSWIHRSVAEYLAARFVATTTLSPNQLASILFHSDGSGRVVPQLQAVAGFLGSLIPEILQMIIKTDPSTVIYGDMTLASDDARRQAVERLLDQVASGDLGYLETLGAFPTSAYSPLAYPGIAETLHPYLSKKDASLPARLLAGEIAEACRVSGLVPLLLGIISDPTEPYRLRIQSARCLSKSGTASELAQLFDVAISAADEDEDDELRGCALTAVWPKHIVPTRQILEAMTRPKNQSLYGAYVHFFSQLFVPAIRAADLRLILDWLALRAATYADGSFEGPPLMAILKLAAQSSQFDSLASSVAHLVLEMVKAPRLRTDVTDFFSVEQRRRILGEILDSTSEDTLNYVLLVARPLILEGDDLEWIFDEALTRSGNSKQRWLSVTNIVTWSPSKSFAERIKTASESDPDVKVAFHLFLALQDATSPESKLRVAAEKRAAKENRDYEREIAKEKRSEPNVPRYIASTLRTASRGDLAAYWRADYAMVNDPSNEATGRWSLRLTSTKYWQAATEAQRQKILRIALDYVNQNQSEPSEWFGRNRIYHPDNAGFRAIVLLTDGQIGKLPRAIVAKWLPILVGFPAYATTDDDKELLTRILSMACEADETAFRSWITDIMCQDDSEHMLQTRLELLTPLIDDKLVTELLTIARRVGPWSAAGIIDAII